ncbi:MAG: SUF system NifU family Fe-S cluster assembly protein [Gammaproteobacteria bacterium]|jgi:nitrogen fixation NifU-like protein|nr:SUF system NifU family Fe-S cluster assembly protein [Gammaproteobacteria bacterium]MDP6616043.1 SUF system NifU family Fe-S cluster assembly protein [Gammaproteobacteria bacterium]MDP6695482.1 SUF system NifU family Fe-S cluster assembly protein [Gammaproteobacteria bacterium]
MSTQEQDLQDIYRHRVLEHSRDPHNFHRPADANREALGFNPLCGDKLNVYLKIEDDHVTDIGFDGTGCAISVASASMMTDTIAGQSLDDAKKMIHEIQDMLAEGGSLENPRLKDLAALEGVRNYPSRIKCATLAWSTLDAALNQTASEVTTE